MMRFNKFVSVLVLFVVFFLVSCKSKKTVTTEHIITTDISVLDTTNVNSMFQTNEHHIYIDSVFVYTVDSVVTDSNGVVHHYHNRKELQKIVENYSKEKDSVINKEKTVLSSNNTTKSTKSKTVITKNKTFLSGTILAVIAVVLIIFLFLYKKRKSLMKKLTT